VSGASNIIEKKRQTPFFYEELKKSVFKKKTYIRYASDISKNSEFNMSSAAEQVFACLELREHLIIKQDTMKQLNTMLCSMKRIEQLPENRTTVERMKENVKSSKAYLSKQTDDSPTLNIANLLRQEKWVHILEKWKEYMINPDVVMATLSALSSRDHHYSTSADSPTSFVPLILPRLHVWTVANQVSGIANMIKAGVFDLVEETMRKHTENHALVAASIEFLLDWFLMMDHIDKECVWHLKIMGGIVYGFKNVETPSLDGSYNNEWYDNLVRDETGLELTEDPADSDVFFEPYLRITDTVDDVGEEYTEASDEAPEKDLVNAQRYMDECTQNSMVYQNVDLRPVVHQVMQWLRTITQQQLPKHG